MAVTIEQAQKIRLLSDGELYDKAVNFVKEYPEYIHSKVSNAQLNGLQNAIRAGDWNEILSYADNRLKRGTTVDELRTFYDSLKKYLEELEEQEEIRYALAKEFIQHLVAEVNYQQQIGESPSKTRGKHGQAVDNDESPSKPTRSSHPSNDTAMAEAFRCAKPLE